MKNGMKGCMGKQEYKNVESNSTNCTHSGKWIAGGLLQGSKRMHEEWSIKEEILW